MLSEFQESYEPQRPVEYLSLYYVLLLRGFHIHIFSCFDPFLYI